MKKKSKNKMNRRMIYLMSKTWPMEYDKYVEITSAEYAYVNPIIDEIFDLAKRLKVLKYAHEIWWTYYRGNKLDLKERYNKMPKRPRQDNKDFLNTQETYSGNRNKIRYPRKKRKTAWKRFWKLFPHLKPEDDD